LKARGRLTLGWVPAGGCQEVSTSEVSSVSAVVEAILGFAQRCDVVRNRKVFALRAIVRSGGDGVICDDLSTG
jgi:hypothetical protein